MTLLNRKIIDEADFTLIKVLGDAVCANEDQIRRYMSSQMSRSETSKRLDRLRTNGVVDRWKVRIRGDEEKRPPAPFTLGIAGYRLLKHYYNDQFFMAPDRWDNYGVGGLKRYVSMNELRCQFIEKKVISKWKWNARLANNARYKFPMSAAEVKTPNGNINFLIDRAQMNQNFIGYFRDKFENWKYVYDKYGSLPISDFPENPQIVIIYTSTISIAEAIHKELLLDTLPFNILFLVEELINENLGSAYYQPLKHQKLQRINVHLQGN
ncbi:replication-relaxation family protein [Niallia sp. MER TA 168]|nr:replication-relaxation family protein [Niallia sp. MER TA 168]